MALYDMLPEAQAKAITETTQKICMPSCKHTPDQDGPEYDPKCVFT